jgi:putative cell wall-binding protein
MASADALGRTKIAALDAATALGSYPFTTRADGTWALSGYRGWTSGFTAGDLWYAYRSTADGSWRTRAARRQTTLAPSAGDTTQHDIGFMLMSSYGNGYELTGDSAYRALLLKAATSLATRYNSKVTMVRTTNAKDAFYVYNDTMMNLQLLFWGASNGGNRAWRQMAANHALRTATDFIRPDGSTFHYVAYNEKTGTVVRKGQGQGYVDSSTWSRGQAWVIYGMAVAYRETCDPRFLDAAHRATDYWVAHVPADLVPYWDFNAPNIPDEPRDSSAAAAAASAFVELARIDPDPARRAAYLDLATRTLDSLCSPAYLAPAGTTTALLLHGTYAAKSGSADTATSWGDYYLREALARYRTQVVRAAGPDRYSTAVRASQMSFPHADTVVLASGEAFADALSASALAGEEHAPLLLVQRTSLPGGVAGEITRLGAKRAIIVGGTKTVAPSVASALSAVVGAGNVSRIAGGDRYDTAALVASRVLAGRTGARAFLVRGDVFSDALSVSPVAYAQGAPVLLTQPRALPASARAVLASGRVSDVEVVGGTPSVAPAVASAVDALPGVSVERIAGPDRYTTSALFAEWALTRGYAHASGATFGLATGANYPDALCGGAVTGSGGGVMLLTPGGSLGSDAGRVLRTRAVADTGVEVFGGVPSVSALVENQARFALPER